MAALTPFLIIPAVEIAVFLLVCAIIGFWPTVLMLVATTIAGAALLRSLGASTLRRAHLQLEQGQITPDEIVSSLWLAAAGLLLVVPGFVTDLVGLALALPVTRRLVGRWLVGRYRAHAVGPGFGPDRSGLAAGPRRPAAAQDAEPPRSPIPPFASGPVIDVEFEDLPPKP